ncbi:MAG: sulfotransferase domain-containing protein [Myxococcota bacterium]|nr:sulfotransferase domain-containing protein [Myxococcota bacterium]
MLRNFFEKLPRRLLRPFGFWLPAARFRRIERWLRGWEQVQKLRRADVALVSYGKSGRTWLRVLLSRFYQQSLGLPAGSVLGFDNFHALNPAIPRIFFTHDTYLGDYTGNAGSKRDFYGKRVVLLVRSPQDVAVSQFFQWKFRMRQHKIDINDFPAGREGSDVSMFEFVMGDMAGLPRIVDFMNLWAREAAAVGEVLVVRYEDLKADTERELDRIVRFVGSAASESAVREAVRFASVENMREQERQGGLWPFGGRYRPGDRDNPDSYKVRRAVVGGYRDYFSDEEVAEIDGFVHSKLDPTYGYGEAAP